jgi:putative transposase
MARYHDAFDDPETPDLPIDAGGAVVAGTLEWIARDGARRMIARMLEEEVEDFLGRPRYAPGGPDTGYRNGYAAEREIGIGTWSVPVRAPRVSDLPEGSEPFRSALLPRGRYLSEVTRSLFARLYLEGLSSGDFEPAMRSLMGERATLSPSTILRLRAEWADEHAAWRARPLTDRHAYIWCDGIHLPTGPDAETSCVLVVIGAREDGHKELLAMEIGYRESTDSWADVLRGLRDRGLASPLLAVGDGVLGLWAALDEVFPATRQQRCWFHKVMNVTDRLPNRLQAEARRQLTGVWGAPTRAEAEIRRDAFAAWLGPRHADVADLLTRDWRSLVAFYDLPQEHWRHLRTTNVVESVFAGVRLRTDVARRHGNRQNALFLVFKIVQRLTATWKPLQGGAHTMRLVLAGVVFRDGLPVMPPAPSTPGAEVPMAA